MAYATIDDVQSLIAVYHIGSQSSVTPAQVNSMIASVSAEIDAVLSGTGVTTPVATPLGFVTHLSLLNAYGVAAMVLKSAFPESAMAGSAPAYAFWEGRYQNGLKALRAGQDIPDDGSTVESDIMPSSYFTRNPTEEEIFSGIEGDSWFSKDRVF